MNMAAFEDAIRLEVLSRDDRDELSRAIGKLLREAYEKKIVPSFIDFNLTTDNEMALTLYAYRRYALHAV